MSILELIQRDAHAIVTNAEEFAGPVTFIHSSGLEVTIDAIHTFHHLGYDIETAQEVNTLKAHICVSEQALADKLYFVRNTDGKVTFEKHKVRATEANGREWLYAVNEWFPNGRTGTVSLILGIHKQ